MVDLDPLPELVLPVEARDHCRGPHGARQTLVEYGDYTSPACRNVAGALNELVRELGDDLCVVFRNFPDPRMGSPGRAAAEAAEAAGLQGKFWLMHDRLLAHPGPLTDRTFREIARSLPVDLNHFERDLGSGEAARRVDEDVEGGVEAGVAATPTFFVNGRLHLGSHEFLPLLEALRRTPSR